jgi:hypothetical protein
MVERRLNASARFLAYGGQHQFVKPVLSLLSTFFLCSLKVQKTIRSIFDRSCRYCFWDKKDDATSPNSLAAWSFVCKPKKHGGLGVLKLEFHNKAVLIK